MCVCLHFTGRCGAGLQNELTQVCCKGARDAHSCPHSSTHSPVHDMSHTGLHTAVPDTQKHGMYSTEPMA